MSRNPTSISIPKYDPDPDSKTRPQPPSWNPYADPLPFLKTQHWLRNLTTIPTPKPNPDLRPETQTQKLDLEIQPKPLPWNLTLIPNRSFDPNSESRPLSQVMKLKFDPRLKPDSSPWWVMTEIVSFKSSIRNIIQYGGKQTSFWIA